MRFVTRRVDISNALVQAAVAAMHLECFGPREDPFKPTFGAWWVVFAGREAVAFAGIQPSVQFEKVGYLARAGVLSKYRGRGLQKRLIKTRLRYAAEQGWSYVVTDTNLNPPSANSLIRCGFTTYQPSKPWGFSTSIYWRKNL